jgi:hydrogenase maturation protease
MEIPPTLIVGYGNPDRQDDGVAWHILLALSERLGRNAPKDWDDGLYPTGESPDLMFVLQLTPELAEIFAGFKRICFVDAHTGAVPEELHLSEIKPEYQKSPFTHHMTASTCLALTQSIYGILPEAILFSVRGYEFGFTHDLSPRTTDLIQQAVQRIMDWLVGVGDNLPLQE